MSNLLLGTPADDTIFNLGNGIILNLSITDSDDDGNYEFITVTNDSNGDGEPDSTLTITDSDDDGKIDSIDASYDFDGDGNQEFSQTISDSDGDGVFEIEIEFDTDDDGIQDDDSPYTGTLEYTDSDGDGVIDSGEVTFDFDNDGDSDITITLSDSDGDGVFEQEVEFDNDNNTSDSIDIKEFKSINSSQNLSEDANNFTNVNSNFIKAFEGDDLIFDLIGNDTIFGDEGNDTISAGSGDDLISGGVGNDFLIGGENSDTFQFDNITPGEMDTIADFTPGVDKIQFVSSDFLSEEGEFNYNAETGIVSYNPDGVADNGDEINFLQLQGDLELNIDDDFEFL